MKKETIKKAETYLENILKEPGRLPYPAAEIAAGAIVIAGAIEDGFEKLAAVIEGK